MMFFFILPAGTMITVSSNTWLGAWMGLEINLLSFIPLMSDNNLMSTEASLKYFLTQALASTVLLFAVILSYMKESLSSQVTEINYISMVILSSLLMKSGSAPFHFWFPNVMEGLSWPNGLILMTWQKIAPLMLTSYVIDSYMITLVIIMSVIVGSIGGLNQTSLRKLMAFSSINHLGWMLAAMKTSESLWFTYFMFYSFLSFAIIFMFNNFKLYHINQLFTSFFNSKVTKFVMFLNLLSLGGLPPFLGFMPKWLVIQMLVSTQQCYLIVILMAATLITLFFYIRVCFAAFLLNYNELSWLLTTQLNNNLTKMMLTTSFISTFGLMLTPLFSYIL
uniref:NADH-ubiquinone oxidoreductase chain 2 n=1 Tax=Prosthiochaeta sp. CAU WL-2019511 TaxID=2813900 RepID=A0A895KU37_9MUSC|nr:NADH dehydrogenase subunit 2 [Prosthiochaeta sp. CAU WL-2019511]